MKRSVSLILFCAMLNVAYSQTAVSPNLGSKVTPGAAPGVFTYSWWGNSGKYYVIKGSSDLTSWQYFPVIDSGGAAPLAYGFSTNSPDFFVRLQESSTLSAAFNELSAFGATATGNYLQPTLLGIAPGLTAAPTRLGNGGHQAPPVVYGTPNPQVTGSVPQLDSAHNGSLGSTEITLSTTADSNVSDGVQLNWTSPGSSEVSTDVQRRQSVGPWKTLATLRSKTSYFDSSIGGNLLGGANYDYRLVIHLGSGAPIKVMAPAPVAFPIVLSTSLITSPAGYFAPSYEPSTQPGVTGDVDITGKYTLALNPSVTGALTYIHLRMPYSDTIYPSFAQLSSTVSTGPGITQAGPFTVDPKAETGQLGYYMFTSAAVIASGLLLQDYDGNYIQRSVADAAEKSGGACVVSVGGGPNPITQGIVLPGLPTNVVSYKINIVGAAPGDIDIADADANVITDGHTVQSQQIANDLNLGKLTISASSAATVGDTAAVKVTFYDGNFGVLGVDSITFKIVQQQPGTLPNYTITTDEASGARYRKIGLNGRPLADEKPHETAESDQEKEETYIDAMTLNLRHGVTDIYIPIAGSDMVLSARRDVASEVWNMHSGLRPHERLDRPFGAGWASNLCPHEDLYTASDGNIYALITDQNGASHKFIQVYDQNFNAAYVPVPTDSRENGDYLAAFDGAVYTDRYGTKIAFAAPVATMKLANDRYNNGSSETHIFSGVAAIRDRLGNEIDYTYPPGVVTLIPQTIAWKGGSGQVLSIAQNSGRITDIWDPNGGHYQYTYQTLAAPASQQLTFPETVLAKVTGPDGQFVQYACQYAEEADQTPASLNSGSPVDPFHIDVTAITDQVGNKYQFLYSFDWTRYSCDSTAGYFAQSGLPSMVTQVTLPGGLGVTKFANNSVVKVGYNNGNPVLTQDSQKQVTVTDPIGDKTTYTFGGSQVFNMGGITHGPPPQVIYYTAMTIDYGAGFKESFTFDPTAGLALSSATDISNNTTSYAYKQPFSNAASWIYQKLFPAGFAGFRPDPTSQTDAMLKSKAFTYGAFEIMSSVTDERGLKKAWLIDPGTGLRKNEIVYADKAATIPLQETDYIYGNASFPGVVTQTTLKVLEATPVGSWEKALITLNKLDANGRVQTRTFDPSSINPGGLNLATQYSYDQNGNKLSVTDAGDPNHPAGNKTQFAYDGRNRLVGTYYADGSMRSIGYYANGMKQSDTDEYQHATSYTYDALNRPLTTSITVTSQNQAQVITTTIDYSDAVQPKDWMTDPNLNKTQYTYDQPLIRPSTVTDPLGNVTKYFYDGPNSGGFAFDSSGFKPTSVTDASKYTTTNTYDALYRLTKSVSQYQLVPAALSSTTQHGYDAVGNPTSVTDDLLHTTGTTFDALNRPLVVTYADTKTTQAWYTSTGLKYQVQDELGFQTVTQYDAAARATALIRPQVDDGLNLGDPNRAPHLKIPTTATAYNPNGTILSVTDPLGNTTGYQYDSRLRRTEEDPPRVTDATNGQVVSAMRLIGYDYTGNVIWKQDARGNATAMQYDEANRLTKTIFPAILPYGSFAMNPSETRLYDAAGNLTNVTDPNLRTTVNGYDKLNRLQSTTDPAGNMVQYGYDAVGNRNSVKDGKQQTTTMLFDGLRRMTTLSDAANQSTNFVYDGVNKTQRTDANGQLTKYAYDLRNRLQTVTYVALGTGRTYAYYADGVIQTVTDTAAGAASNVAYAYDNGRRLTSETSNGVQHTYTPDLAGNRLQAVYGARPPAAGRTLVSTYDTYNRLSTLTEATRATQYGYDLNGNLVKKTLPNGEVVAMGYDALNRMQSEQDTSPRGVLYNYLSLCDPAGNLCYSSEYTAGVALRTLVLGYDNADRLTSETALDANGNTSSQTSYGYDPANNRTSKTVNGVTATFAYNNVNEVTGWSDTSGRSGAYTYDNNGSRKTRASAGLTDTYSYDYENRVVGLTKNTAGGTQGAYAWAYDYRTRRVSRTEPVTGGTSLVFSGGTSVQEYNGSNALTVDYVRGSDWGGGVGGILYSLRANAPSFAHYDRRGDVTARTDTTGAITYQASYEAEGTHAVEFGSTPDRQKANTKEEDPTGLVDEGHRYRDFETDTFITRDPAGFVDGPNLYAYVRQNPWTKFDPEGLDGQDAGTGMRNHFQQIIDNIDDPDARQSAQKGMQDGQRAAAAFANGASAAVSIFPPESAAEAISGRDATGASMSVVDRAISIVGAIPEVGSAIREIGGAAKIAGETAKATKVEKEVAEVSKTAKTLAKDSEAAANAAKAAETAPNLNNTVNAVEDFLGGQGKIIKNADGDTILMRGDKKIRFDIKDPHGDKPHFHLEQQTPSGKWKDAGPEHRYYFKEDGQ